MTYNAYQSCPSCSGRAQPGTVALLQYTLTRFPYARSLGIYNCRNVGGTGSLSIHACGRALDVGIPTLSNGRANTTLGHPIIQFFDKHSTDFGIMGQIYDRVRYDSRSPRGRLYGGVHPHYDHDHVEQVASKAQSLTYAQIVAIAGPSTGDDQVLDRNSPKPSSAVAMFQRDLIHLGYDLGDWPSIQPSLYPKGADGSFGDDAEAGAKAFQTDMELVPTGVGDALTVALAANLARFNQIRAAGSGGGDHPDADHAGLATKAALTTVSDKLNTHTADVRTNTPHS